MTWLECVGDYGGVGVGIKEVFVVGLSIGFVGFCPAGLQIRVTKKETSLEASFLV